MTINSRVKNKEGLTDTFKKEVHALDRLAKNVENMVRD
jgi:hypothetical protein